MPIVRDPDYAECFSTFVDDLEWDAPHDCDGHCDQCRAADEEERRLVSEGRIPATEAA